MVAGLGMLRDVVVARVLSQTLGGLLGSGLTFVVGIGNEVDGHVGRS